MLGVYVRAGRTRTDTKCCSVSETHARNTRPRYAQRAVMLVVYVRAGRKQQSYGWISMMRNDLQSSVQVQLYCCSAVEQNFYSMLYLTNNIRGAHTRPRYAHRAVMLGVYVRAGRKQQYGPTRDEKRFTIFRPSSAFLLLCCGTKLLFHALPDLQLRHMYVTRPRYTHHAVMLGVYVRAGRKRRVTRYINT